MQRRFEMYRIRDDVPRAVVEEFSEILRHCGEYIPQLMDSIAAESPSERGVNFVWEHAYTSADTYEEYMCHPYHICVLDRYLLPDAPGLITERDDSQLGLLGYEIDEPAYRRGEGVAQDPIQAYLWATLATRQENHLKKLAEALQETLAAKMTPAQIAEAERLADAWIETHRKAE